MASSINLNQPVSSRAGLICVYAVSSGFFGISRDFPRPDLGPKYRPLPIFKN